MESKANGRSRKVRRVRRSDLYAGETEGKDRVAIDGRTGEQAGV